MGCAGTCAPDGLRRAPHAVEFFQLSRTSMPSTVSNHPPRLVPRRHHPQRLRRHSRNRRRRRALVAHARENERPHPAPVRTDAGSHSQRVHLRPPDRCIPETQQRQPPVRRLFYLLTHGLVKVILVVCLWMNKLWAYPLTIAVFGLFMLYQMARFTHTHSIALVLLTIFDGLIIYLTWMEFQRPKTANGRKTNGRKRQPASRRAIQRRCRCSSRPPLSSRCTSSPTPQSFFRRPCPAR